jgi:hypothetical protein
MSEYKENLIKKINQIINHYFNKADIHAFYTKLCHIDDDIHYLISETLYKEFKTEHLCIYYELVYSNDKDDADIIVNDCINILQRIINIIKK